jgi:hypothetical protein
MPASGHPGTAARHSAGCLSHRPRTTSSAWISSRLPRTPQPSRTADICRQAASPPITERDIGNGVTRIRIDAPMSVNGSDDVLFFNFRGWGNVALAGAAGCGQDREGPLRVEGRLLLGHAGSGSGGGRGRPTNRLEASTWVRQPIRGQAAPGVGAVSQRRRGGGGRPRGRRSVSGSA